MKDDGALLREFRQGRSEPAFREIVQRHIDLVYSTALRGVCGDSHLAEDVTQVVFTELALQAARLSPGIPLAGWLYRTACFTAAKVVRNEQRRRTREQIAMEITSVNQDAHAEWEKLAPHLDGAMNDLRAAERDAVVLRFFAHQDYAAVGAALGISEDAAQKRVSRALEKLRKRLAGRGAMVAVSTLGSVLGAEAVTVAPVGLAGTVTTTAVAGAAVATIPAAAAGLNLMTLTKLKIAVIGSTVALAVATPLALQQRSIHRLRDENARLRQQTSQLPLQDETSRVSASAERILPDDRTSELLRLRNEVSRLGSELRAARASTNREWPNIYAGFEGMNPSLGLLRALANPDGPSMIDPETGQSAPGPTDAAGATKGYGAYEWTWLHHSAFHGLTNDLQSMLQMNPNVDVRDRNGRTPLFQAVLNRDPGHGAQAALLLLQHGANVNAPDHSGETPLQAAIRLNRPEIADLLRQWGATQ